MRKRAKLRVSLALVLALSLFLLAGAAVPVQGGKMKDGDYFICVQTVTWAECTGVPRVTTGYPYTEHNCTEQPMKVLTAKSDAKAKKSGQTWAEASAIQHASCTKSWGLIKSESKAAPGEDADAYAWAMADPVASGGIYKMPIPNGILLKATGSSTVEAEVSIDVEYQDTGETIWHGWAKFSSSSPSAFDSEGDWRWPWNVGSIGAGYPRDEIEESVDSNRPIYTYIIAKTHIVGGGKAHVQFNLHPVGGIAFPVDKLALLAPYIALAVAVVAVAVGTVYGRKCWLGKPVVTMP